jgi:hypothetical protein
MRKKNILIVFFAVLVTMGNNAFAADGNITGVSVTPANPKPGEPITVKVTGTITPGKTCQILFLKGDGTPQSLGKNATSFPATFGGDPYPLWIYNNPGTYTVKVYPSAGPSNNCTGSAQTTVKVSNPTPPTAGINTGVVVAMTNPCPQGWHKVSGQANGAFTCKPNKPAPIQCPPKHQYFETECAVGCQQVIY